MRIVRLSTIGQYGGCMGEAEGGLAWFVMAVLAALNGSYLLATGFNLSLR